jgi:hypothetical protein
MHKSLRLTLMGSTLMSLALAVCSCAGPPTVVNNGPDNVNKGPDTNDHKFHQALLDVAATYQNYGEIDSNLRYAPWLCGAQGVGPTQHKISVSTDSHSHGKKVYFLFVKDKTSYLKDTASTAQSPSTERAYQNILDSEQVIVKESWYPKAVPIETPVPLGSLQPTELAPSTKSALFIMMKSAPDTPDTDEGWIYGTLTPDGKTVTSAGRVQSCMACHQAAPHGRLFGLNESNIAFRKHVRKF